MSTHAAAVQTAVLAGDGPGAVAAAHAVPATHRPAVLRELEQAYSAASTARFTSPAPAGTRRGAAPDPSLAGLAVACAALDDRAVGSASRIVWLVRVDPAQDAPFLDPDLWADAVGGRPKAWRSRLVRALLSGEEHNAALRWSWVDALVRRGAVDSPDLATDVLWVLHQPWSSLTTLAADNPRVAQHLDRLLSTPGVGRELKYAEQRGGWAPLLAALHADAPAGRARVLDETLAGLLGSLPESDSEGLVLLARALDPTDVELAARQSDVLDLLLARRAPVAALAREWSDRLVADRTLDGDALLAVTPDALALPRKNAVVGQLGLVKAATVAGLVEPPAAAHALAAGLDPSRPDLAVKVARLVGSLATSLSADEVVALRGDVLAAAPEWWADLRTALGAVGAERGTPEEDGTGADVAVRPVPVDLPAPGRVEPVTDRDELVELVARMATDGGLDPVEIERALDGMARLRGLPPGVAASFDGRWAAAGQSGPDQDVTAVVRAWAGLSHQLPHGLEIEQGCTANEEEVPTGPDIVRNRTVEQHPVLGPEGMPVRDAHGRLVLGPAVRWRWERRVEAWGPEHLVRRRLAAATLMATRTPATSLAAPTRSDGTLDLETFRARRSSRAAAGAEFWAADVGAALLRLTPQDRAELQRGTLPDSTRAVLQVLDRPQQWVRGVIRIGTRWARLGDREVWVSAHPEDGGPEDPVRSWLDTRTVAADWPTEPEAWKGLGFLRFPAWWALMLPGRPDLLAVHLQPALMGWADSPGADLSAPLSALGRAPVPLGGPSAAALVWGAGAASVSTRAAAAEAITVAARTGMLTGAVLGREVRTLLGPDAAARPHEGEWPPVAPRVNRVAGALTDAARIDEHGEVVVLDALMAALDVLHEVRNGALLLELAATIAGRRRVRVDLPPALAALAEGRGSTRMAQEARRLAGAGR